MHDGKSAVHFENMEYGLPKTFVNGCFNATVFGTAWIIVSLPDRTGFGGVGNRKNINTIESFNLDFRKNEFFQRNTSYS